MTVAERAAQFICHGSSNDDDIKDMAVRCFSDTFGCMLLGCGEGVPRAAMNVVRRGLTGGQASVYCREPFKTDVRNAAFINAISSHVCDYDNMTTAGCGHPSIPVFPVVLALGEALHKTGDEMLNAYIKGMEVSMRLGFGLSERGLDPAWNPTTVFGVFGATAAAAKLLNLSQDQTCWALGMASCEAGGTKGNYGTGAKNITVGHLCMKGIGCAKLAKEGIRSSADTFENPNGFIRCFMKEYDRDAVFRAFDCETSFLLDPGIIQKPYPTCRSNHNAIDGAVWIHNLPGFSIEDVDYAECCLDAASMRLDTYRIPENPEEAKFSTSYCIALSLLYGDIKSDYFLDGAGINEAAREFIKKIHIIEKNDFHPYSDFAAYLKVYSRDGTYWEYMGERAKGDSKKPMSQKDQYAKFADCLSRMLHEAEIKEIYDQLSMLGYCDDFNSIKDVVLKKLAGKG